MNFFKGTSRDVSRMLGPYAISSHPHHYVKRRQNCIIFAIVPLLLLLSFLVVKFLFDFLGTTSPKEVVDAFVNFGTWFKSTLALLMGLFVFAIGFGCCGLLIVLSERYEGFSLLKPSTRNNITAPWWWILGIAVLIGTSGVLIILFTESSNLDFVVSVLLMGPVLLLILLLGPAQDWVHGHKSKGNRILVTLNFIVFGFIISLYVSSFVAGWTNGLLKSVTDQIPESWWAEVQKREGLAEWVPKNKGDLLKGLDDVFRSLIVTLNIVFLASYLLWRKPEKKKKKRKVKKKSFINKVVGFCKQAIGIQPTDTDEELMAQDWILDFKDMYPPPEGCGEITDLNDPKLGLSKLEHSSVCSNSNYRSFFGDSPPSVDQDKALNLFLNGVQRDWGAIRSGDEANFDTGDMLITGAVGSGRKQWLVAASMAARMNRGDIVLVICKDREESISTVASIRKVNSGSPLPSLLYVDRMDAKIRAALEADRLSALPDILVATRSDMENAFFREGELAGHGKSSALRMIDSIFVTDISQFSSKDRFELPYLLGKIRLINEVDDKFIQIAIIVPVSVSKDVYVEELVKSRLLSPIRKLSQKPFEIRPLRNSADEEFFVPTDDPATAFSSLAKYFLLKGQSVVIVKNPNNGNKSDIEEENILPPNVPSNNLQIVSSIEEIEVNDDKTGGNQENTKNRWRIILRSYVRGEVGLPLPSKRDVAGIAIVHVSETEYQSSEFVVQSSEPFLPVMGSSRSDEGTLAKELSKVVPYLTLGKFSHRNVWKQFGIPKPGALTIFDPKSGEETKPHFSFRIDPPEAGVGQEPLSDPLHRVERVMQLESRGVALTIDEDGKEDSIYSLRLESPSNTSLKIVSRKLLDKHLQRIVVWDAAGHEFPSSQGVLDLAQANTILIDTDGGRFSPKSLDPDPQGRLKITCRRVLDLDEEQVCPIWSGEVNIPPDISLSTQSLNRPDYIAWNRIHRNDGSLIAAPATVKWTLNGRFAASGTKKSLLNSPVSFEYEASSSLLMLGDFEQAKEEDVIGDWSIQAKQDNRIFWPELTSALMAALIKCSPDTACLGRLLAFQSNDNMEYASVLITELPDTSGTFEEIFLLIQESEELRKIFYTKAISVLNDARGKSGLELFHILGGSARQSMGDFESTLCGDSSTIAAIDILEKLLQG